MSDLKVKSCVGDSGVGLDGSLRCSTVKGRELITASVLKECP